jgi:ADP-dependent NAD(P)H-hydrate dehydratase / NAD(P)H-hydrate epimerase
MMPGSPDQILTVAQMRTAEEALIAAGSSVETLMDIAGRGAADWVWRLAAHRPVTVLCGPGNNGGDGYVIAKALRERGCKVAVVAATDPKTEAARNARSLFGGEVFGPEARPNGEVLVDCLFGSGLTRALGEQHVALLGELACSHRQRVAIDLPSGIESDTGAPLNPGLPRYDLTVALGAWKFAHFLMPATPRMGVLKPISIGVAPVPGAAQLIGPPRLSAPPADTHKYRRGLLGVVTGDMPGASVLAATAAQRAGAGYVKLLGDRSGFALPPDLVLESRPLPEALSDTRLSALLVGPGLGRNARGRERLAIALAADRPTVLDADGLVLAWPAILDERTTPLIATPHGGELAALEAAFGLDPEPSKPARAQALAHASGMIVVAKGPDTLVAAPDGRLALAPLASSWLSTAGTGDVLAGLIASRLASGLDAFEAACEGVWLHAEAARRCGSAFTAGELAHSISAIYDSIL